MTVDKTVARETKYMLLWTGIFSILMQAIFLVIGKWHFTVLTGNILGYFIINLNFFLMGLTVQSAVKKEEKDAKALIRASHTARSFMIFALALIGVLLPFFNMWAVIIPLFFPRIALAIKPLADKSAFRNDEKAEDAESFDE